MRSVVRLAQFHLVVFKFCFLSNVLMKFQSVPCYCTTVGDCHSKLLIQIHRFIKKYRTIKTVTFIHVLL